MLYHAYDQEHIYKLGVCLLDRDDPGRVLPPPARSRSSSRKKFGS
jgi:predicted GH43/DUF377 family glycosyl hydrolase